LVKELPSLKENITMKENVKKNLFLLMFGLFIFFGTPQIINAQFEMFYSKSKIITCYAPGKEYERTVDPRWDDTGFAFFPTTIRYNSDVQPVFDEISSNIETMEKIYVVATTDTKNAEACRSDKGKFFILFNPTWLGVLYKRDSKSLWVLRAILAHETGHIELGHTTKYKKSEPPMELEADEFAGQLLAKMGAKLTDVEEAYNSRLFQDIQQGTSHPPLNQRLERVKRGWQQIQSTKTKANETTPWFDWRNKTQSAPQKKPNPWEDLFKDTTKSKPQSVPQSKPKSDPQKKSMTWDEFVKSLENTTKPQSVPKKENPVYFVSKCIFYGDPNIYLVDSNNNIISRGVWGDIKIGGKTASSLPVFAWIFSTVRGHIYGVDYNGYIWVQTCCGNYVNVGIVTNP